MTIYALVNQLVSEFDNTRSNAPVWTIISAASVLQGGNPYFVPDFASRFEARLALAVRIGKLGKGIAPKFAHRYVDAVAPCVLFVADDLLDKLKAKGLPWTPAVSYDRSLAIGQFVKIEYDEIKSVVLTLNLDSADFYMSDKWSDEFPNSSLEDIINSISRDNTLKTGDLILVGISKIGHKVSPDMKASLLLNGNPSVSFNIR